jgi:hypothetical protein
VKSANQPQTQKGGGEKGGGEKGGGEKGKRMTGAGSAIGMRRDGKGTSRGRDVTYE